MQEKIVFERSGCNLCVTVCVYECVNECGELTLNIQCSAGSKGFPGSGTACVPAHIFLDICVCRWPDSHFAESLPQGQKCKLCT